jgi:hypothetical protein
MTILLLPIALMTFVMGNHFPRVADRLELGDTEQRIQMALGLSLFVVAGLSTMIAEQLGFQPTVVILLLMSVILFRQLLPSPIVCEAVTADLSDANRTGRTFGIKSLP